MIMKQKAVRYQEHSSSISNSCRVAERISKTISNLVGTKVMKYSRKDKLRLSQKEPKAGRKRGIRLKSKVIRESLQCQL